MKNEKIAQAFNNNEEATNSNKSFFVKRINGVLIAFSYGEHFPICLKFVDGFLFNKNTYSNTTARHKNLILYFVKHELTDSDYKTTEELKSIVDKIKYSDLKTKAEVVEMKI